MTGFRSLVHGVEDTFSNGPPAAPLATAITLAKPAGVVAGDILVAAFTAESFVSGGGTLIKIAPQVTPWTTISNTTATGNMRIFWRLATIAEPSSYTFNFQRISDSSSHAAFATGIIAAYEGFSGPVRLSLATGSALVTQSSSLVPPATSVVDIPSATLHGTETTTGGLAFYFWNATESIENFDGSVGSPPAPGSLPYAGTTITAPTQHDQVYYAGTPSAGEWSPIFTSGITFRVGNQTLTIGSQILGAAALPDGTATFTWQHAGAEGGFGEFIMGFRFVLEATYVLEPYWGILGAPA